MESERLLVLTKEAWNIVGFEIARSRSIHPPMIDHFHAYGVIKEELEEFFDSIKKNKPDIGEVAQVVGCCIMTLQDTNNRDKLYLGNFSIDGFMDTFSYKPISSYHQTYAFLRCYLDFYWESVKYGRNEEEIPLINMVDFGVSGLIFALGRMPKHSDGVI